jgi:hypothetical protein
VQDRRPGGRNVQTVENIMRRICTLTVNGSHVHIPLGDEHRCADDESDGRYERTRSRQSTTSVTSTTTARDEIVRVPAI